jgi:hypothetical protein
MDKITSLLERLCTQNVRDIVGQAMEAMRRDYCFRREAESSGFERWIGNLPIITSLSVDAGPQSLIHHIKWASRARWKYAEQLTSLLSKVLPETPLWVTTIYKLGRYFAATKAMVKFALRRPEVFRSIQIKVVDSPGQQAFSLKDNRALTDLLARLGRTDKDDIKAQLGCIWFANSPQAPVHVDAESYFRKKCSHKLALHAEMQLITFYDRNPQLRPLAKFMGTSKKSCYLCQKFLSHHWLKMAVSASHQKLWPSWMPPSDGIYRDLLWKIKRDLEKSAAQELLGQLGHRRPANLDSTAGPPITFTSTFCTTNTSLELASSGSYRDPELCL